MATAGKNNQQQGYIITSRKSFHDQKEGKKHKFQHHNIKEFQNDDLI